MLKHTMWKGVVFCLFAMSLAQTDNDTPGTNNGATNDDTAGNKQYQFVDMVAQNFNTVGKDETTANSTNARLSAQIKIELEASYIYQAYASYFQRADVNLPGIQKFFTKSSAEEKHHAQLLIDYVNKRGGDVFFYDLDLQATCKKMVKVHHQATAKKDRMCICNWVAPKEINNKCPTTLKKPGLLAFNDALAVERFVNAQLLKLHAHADAVENDPHLAHFLEHEFLEEQIESIKELANHVTRLSSFSDKSYHLGEYLFDEKLNQ